MVINQSVACARPQQELSDPGAQFRALASGQGTTVLRAGNSAEKTSVRARSNQSNTCDTEEEGALLEAGRQRSHDENDHCLADDLGGVSVSSLLANLLVESSRSSISVGDHWKLIVPLERTRFPDSSALIYAGPGSIVVQFRSYHGSVVSMLGSILDAVSSMARQGLNRSVQCDVRQVSTVSELYQ